MPSLAVVPLCTGECRLVRVTGVLIFAEARTCVASVLRAAGPLGHCADALFRIEGPGDTRLGTPRQVAATTPPQSAVLARDAFAGISTVTNRVCAQCLEL